MRNLDPEVIVVALNFLRLIRQFGGRASRHELPSMGRMDDRARRACRNRDFALYKDGHWHITDKGRQAISLGEVAF